MRLGAGGFTDKPIPPFGTFNDFCFHNFYRLAEDGKAAVVHLAGDLQNQADTNPPHAQLEALIRSAVSKKVGWRRPFLHPRILVVLTDAVYFEAGDGRYEVPSLRRNNGSGMDDCSAVDYPSVAAVRRALVSQQIVPMFVTRSNVFEEYQSLVKRLGFGFAVDITAVDVEEQVSAALTAICSDVVPEVPEEPVEPENPDCDSAEHADDCHHHPDHEECDQHKCDDDNDSSEVTDCPDHRPECPCHHGHHPCSCGCGCRRCRPRRMKISVTIS